MQLDSKDEATLLVTLSKFYCNVEFPFAIQTCTDHGWAITTLRASIFQLGLQVQMDAGPDSLTLNITL